MNYRWNFWSVICIIDHVKKFSSVDCIQSRTDEAIDGSTEEQKETIDTADVGDEVEQVVDGPMRGIL